MRRLVEVRLAWPAVPLDDKRHRKGHHADGLQDEEYVVVLIERVGRIIEDQHEDDRPEDERAQNPVEGRAPSLGRHDVLGEDEKGNKAEKDEQRPGEGQVNVGQPELARRGMLRSGMEERGPESADAGERGDDIVYRQRGEPVRQQEDADNAQRSGKDISDVRVVVPAKGRPDMAVNGSVDEQDQGEYQADVPDYRPHVAIRKRLILAPRRIHNAIIAPLPRQAE